MREKIQLEKILFLDIETVPQYYNYHESSDEAKKLFASKSRSKIKEEKTVEDVYNDSAGILAEFG